MKSFLIPIMAATLLAVFVSSAEAQSPAPVPARATQKRTPSATTKRRIPPAPPITMARSRYRSSATKQAAIGDPDPSGRKDMVGGNVPFYPVSRGAKAVQNAASPIKLGKRSAK